VIAGALALSLSLLAVEPGAAGVAGEVGGAAGGAPDLRARPPAAGSPGAEETTVSRSVTPLPSLMTPPRPRDLTRVATTWRPFLGFSGNSWGTIGEARIEHHFARPFMLGVELSPVALASAGDGLGAATHVRVIGAFVTDHLSLGLGVGARLQRFGPAGLSIAPSLRLGSLDGLHLELTYAHTLAPNRFTNQMTTGFSNVLARVQVPVARRLALQLDTGLSLDTWGYVTLGMRHRLSGDGGRGTWFVTGAFGLAMVVDKSVCTYTVDNCGTAATSYGPTVSFGLEYRF
jgi:hypothetical protein